MITLSCTCGKQFQLKDEMAGKRAKCSCGQILRVPGTAANLTSTAGGTQAGQQALDLAESGPMPILPPQAAPQPGDTAPLAALPSAHAAVPSAHAAVPSAHAAVLAAQAAAPQSAAAIPALRPPTAAALSQAASQSPQRRAPTAGGVPRRSEYRDPNSAISWLSSLSAAGLTVLLMAVCAYVFFDVLRKQRAPADGAAVAVAPAAGEKQAKPQAAPPAELPPQKNDETKPTESKPVEGKTAESKAGENKIAETTSEAGTPKGDAAVKPASASPATPTDAAQPPATGSADALEIKPPPATDANKTNDSATADPPATPPDQPQAPSDITSAASAAEIKQASSADRFRRLLADLHNLHEGRAGNSMSLAEAVQYCEFYPEHLPKVNFEGCLVHSKTLNHASLLERYGQPDEKTDLHDDTLRVQGRTVDLSSKPSSMLRYGWLELIVSADGEIWAVKRWRDTSPAK